MKNAHFFGEAFKGPQVRKAWRNYTTVKVDGATPKRRLSKGAMINQNEAIYLQDVLKPMT